MQHAVYTTRQVMPSSGEVLCIGGLGRRQAAAVTAPMGSFPDCVLRGMLTGIAKKKKKIERELCNVSVWAKAGL